MDMQTSTHDKISPTAKLVAYWRQFTDIPYSKDIASLFKTEAVMADMFKDQAHLLIPGEREYFVPYVEVRYKSIQNVILKKGLKQVLEFASGVSLRGLAMTQDPSLTYIETDLPGITEEKSQLVATIMRNHGITSRNNLFFCSVNILNYAEIEPVLAKLDPKKPLAIVNEGLFHYLSMEEKEIAAQNIYKILSQFGGSWITPDFDTRSEMKAYHDPEKKYEHFMDVITQATGRDLLNYSFDAEADIYAFFSKIGFKVEIQSQMDPDVILSSTKDKLLSAEDLAKLNSLRLWVMTV